MKKGDVIAVTFLDHVESPKEAKAERFTVYGRLIAQNSRAIVVGSWVYSAKSKRCDQNTTTYTILRACVEKIEQLDTVSVFTRQSLIDLSKKKKAGT